MINIEHPHVLAAYQTEELGKRVLNIITDIEICPDKVGFDAQARHELKVDMEKLLGPEPHFDRINMTTHRRPESA